MPRHSQTGHTWYKSALSGLFFRDSLGIFTPENTKRAQRANSCRQRPRHIRHKQKSVYPRAHVAHLTYRPPFAMVQSTGFIEPDVRL